MPDLPFQTFRNPYKETLVSGLQGLRSGRVGCWEGVISQVGGSGIPTGNQGLRSGRVGCWEGVILRFWNPYNIVRLEGLWRSGIPTGNQGLRFGRVGSLRE